VVPESTKDRDYTERLISEGGGWKRLVRVQAPYRWNLRRLSPGFVLDLGCGIGRNLAHLDGNGVGIDHNASSVEFARARGLKAFTPEEFRASDCNRAGSFDSILAAHVLEHMTEPEAVDLLNEYAPLVKESGRMILITPQEAGFKSDPTHVEVLDFARLRSIAASAGFALHVKEYSFPFPRAFGRIFKHNEFVAVYRRR
jgi:2-polyprenyl-3-methyl-5-hydroxy-6-metoxy-1,4-benzoquinol methylase